ncbi:MAG TPA: hypothetical protein PLK90_00115 [Clostridiales bacterium]|nr:hypothetical protein [Clostridiales bacterium]HQP68788.1 hypothetical protein [Clostridiales bacterium]
MITFIKSKYSDTSDGRDTLLKITQIENLIRPDSFFSYLCALRITEDMPENVRFSQKDTDKFLILKNKIPWTIKKPYIRFEAEILPVMDEIGYHLNAKKTSSLEKYNAKVIEAERLIEKYAEDSCMVDPEIFIEFHNKLNLLKDILRRDSYVFYELRSDEMFDELNRINTDNKEKYTNIYLVAKKKYEVSKNFFAKYKDYIGPKEIKTLQEQYLLIDKLFQSRRYDLMNKAVELINRTDSKITEIVNAKKQNMIINLNRQIDKLKPSIWLEDWEILKKNVSVMIKEAEETGSLLNLNLDR